MSNDAQAPQRESFGYVLDVPYTWSYFRYQSPLLLSYVAALNGFQAPDPNRPFTHLDLGCGNGVTSNLLASAYPHGQFFGLDFNTEHIVNARAVADKAGLGNVTFLDASFEEIFDHDPPQFDYITLHGVYSWVGSEVRAQVDAVIDRLLKPGGLVYLCYNTLPGAANLAPLWKMMQTYSAGRDGDVVENAQAALKAITEIRENNGRFFRDNPTASLFLDKMLKRDARYLVHEFSNGCYEPQYFSDVAGTFADFGLEYCGSAKLYRNTPRNFISRRHFAHIDGASDAIERESRGSFVRNESFRWDVFTRGSREDVRPEAMSLMNTRFGLVRPLHLFGGTSDAGRRTLDLTSGLNARVLKIVERGSQTLQELVDASALNAFDRDDVVACVIDLVSADCLQPILKQHEDVDPSDDPVFRIADPVNRVLIEDRLLSEGKTYVSSPVSGTAQRLDFVNALYVWTLDGLCLSELQSAFEQRLQEMARDTGYRFVSEKDVTSPEFTARRMRVFFSNYLPRLVALGVLKPEGATETGANSA